jgi:ABC-type multidrug transport system fused ATPase/permease subunit
MLKRIEIQINDFMRDIKEAKGCDEMLSYVHSSFFAAVKLLMFASTVFSLYVRVMLFFVIASAGLLLFSIIGAIPASTAFLFASTLVLFIMLLVYIMQCRKMLINSIQHAKQKMQ